LVTSAAPLGTIMVKNRRGSVDVGVPAAAGFTVQASTRHGSMEDDFDLPKSGSEESPELKATVGRGGPTVTIDTTDGDVTLRKSSVEPLSLTPPAPPKLTLTPPPPPVAAPKAPRAPKVKAPAPPMAPKP
jgi:putative adhesin